MESFEQVFGRRVYLKESKESIIYLVMIMILKDTKSKAKFLVNQHC